jgi:hypothetical protein
MRKPEKTQQETFATCSAEGAFNTIVKPDVEKIQTMLTFAMADLSVVTRLKETAKRDSYDWNVIFKIHYDTLHALNEAFVRFDKIKVDTHECLFAYLCTKHPELDFDWNTLETIRKMRNLSIYEGVPITYDKWKKVELQLALYINKLKKSVEEKLKTEK